MMRDVTTSHFTHVKINDAQRAVLVLGHRCVWVNQLCYLQSVDSNRHSETERWRQTIGYFDVSGAPLCLAIDHLNIL